MKIIQSKNKQALARRIAIFGGSFNPPHRGHVAMLRALLRLRWLDEIWVMPVYQHPWNKELLPFVQRWALCRLAFAQLSPRVTLKRLEAQLGGVSYSIRTAQALKKRFPQTQWFWVVGADSYRARRQWRDFVKLAAIVGFIVFPRGKESEIPAVSSTEIRKRCREGRSIRALVPAATLQYIKRRHLWS